MFTRFLDVSAVLISCPALVFSQDVSFLFGGSLPEAGEGAATSSLLINDPSVSSGSVNIYSRFGFDFTATSLDFSSSDPSVVQFTGGEAFNPEFNSVGGLRFDTSALTISADGSEGNLFSVSLMGTGVNQAFSSLDPLFDSTVSVAGSFLLARVDFDIVGSGTTEFNLSDVGDSIGVDPQLPAFGSATFIAAPEPSSANLLVMGCVALVARRKRV